MRRFPPPDSILSGQPLIIRLIPAALAGDRLALLPAGVISGTLSALARNVEAQAHLRPSAAALEGAAGEAWEPLRCTKRVEVNVGAVTLELPIPPDARVGVVVIRVRVAGAPLLALGQGGTLTLSVAPGLSPPQQFSGHTTNFWQLPCVSSRNGGRVFVPRHHSDVIAVFSTADASSCPPILLSELGFVSPASVCYAAADDRLGLLFFADRESGRIIAVDADSYALRWSTRADPSGATGHSCGGLAVLVDDGVIAASDLREGAIRAFSSTNGELIGELRGLAEPSFLAFDDAASELYVSVKNFRSGSDVVAVRWSRGGAFEGPARSLPIPVGHYTRPLAVIAGPMGRRSLAVATFFTAALSVYELPSLVPTRDGSGADLEINAEVARACIVGLAADPAGTAILVCDRSTNAVHALPWPLKVVL